MALSQKEVDIQMLLAAGCHLGTKNCSFQVRRGLCRLDVRQQPRARLARAKPWA
jgi:hypothetical protein